MTTIAAAAADVQTSQQTLEVGGARARACCAAGLPPQQAAAAAACTAARAHGVQGAHGLQQQHEPSGPPPRPHACSAPAAHHPPGAGTPRSPQTLNFDNTFVRELPADPERSNVLRQVSCALFSRVDPTPAAGEPRTLAFSRQARLGGWGVRAHRAAPGRLPRRRLGRRGGAQEREASSRQSGGGRESLPEHGPGPERNPTTPRSRRPTDRARQVCELLDLDPAECERPEFALVMAGAAPLPGR
jgi:hypothetical protein